jgi:hypothetical protein
MAPNVFASVDRAYKLLSALKARETTNASTYVNAIGFSKNPAAVFPIEDVKAGELVFAPLTHFSKIVELSVVDELDAKAVQQATCGEFGFKLGKPLFDGDATDATAGALIPFWCVEKVSLAADANMKVTHVKTDEVAFWVLENKEKVAAFSKLKVYIPALAKKATLAFHVEPPPKKTKK